MAKNRGLPACGKNQEPLPGCFVRIRDALPRFSETERRVCRVILQYPRQIILSSVVELAERAKVSAATIVRLCRKLGYSGFAQFKIVLSQDLVAPLENIHEDISTTDDIQVLLKKVTHATIQALRDTLQVLDAKSVEHAINLLDRAARITCIGMGGSGSLAVDAQHKFLRTGKPCLVYTDKHLQLIATSLMNQQDTVLAVTHTGANRDLLEVCQVARSAGARLITITHFAHPPVTRLADVSLFTSSRETSYRPESMSSRIATLNIVDILYVGLSLRNHRQMIRNLARVRRAIAPTRV